MPWKRRLRSLTAGLSSPGCLVGSGVGVATLTVAVFATPFLLIAFHIGLNGCTDALMVSVLSLLTDLVRPVAAGVTGFSSLATVFSLLID